MKKSMKNLGLFLFCSLVLILLSTPIFLLISLMGTETGIKLSTLWITAFASLSALTISVFGKWIESLYRKPKLEAIRPIEKYDQGIQIWRLLIRNNGNKAARSTSAEIVSIKENGSGKPRKNFLPSPLVWTHQQRIVGISNDKEGNPRSFPEYFSERNILPGQTAYLDVIKLEDNKFKLTTTINLDGHPDFSVIKEGTSFLEIKLFENSGAKLSIAVKVELEGTSLKHIEIC